MTLNYKLIHIFLPIILCNALKAQTGSDTIYFDRNWSICEQPVAEYYRVGTLNKESNIFYKDTVADYYIDGKIEMSGKYSNLGLEHGFFTFYYSNGKIKKQGNFLKGEMKGLWNFYDSLGNLKVQYMCNGFTDLTPILIINNANDTLLKNGNGKYAYNTQKDLPEVFPPACLYEVEGKVKDGKKDGTITYTNHFDDKVITRSEVYKNGEFKKGQDFSYAFGNISANKPFTFLNLQDPNLVKVDNFYHSNIVFDFGNVGDQKVVNFLLKNDLPEIKAEAKSFKDDYKDIYLLVSGVLREKLIKHDAVGELSFRSNISTSNAFQFLSFEAPLNNISAPRMLNSDVTLTIDTMGYLINSSFKGNLQTKEINEINYYFSRLSGLAPYQINGISYNTNINFKIQSIADTIKNQSRILYRYFIIDQNAMASSLNDSSYEYEKIFKEVQIEAIFPGGQGAWVQYLARNLNADVPYRNHAPSGNYTVIVSFLVDKEGNVSEVHALNNPGYGTAEEAVRVIKKGPAWTPAVMNGTNVIYRQKQSITFQVSN